MLIRQEFITSQKLGFRDFWRTANSVLNKDKSAIPPLFNGPEVLSSASDKAKLFAKNYSKDSSLNGWGISSPVFPSRTNLKLHNFFVTRKIVIEVITNLDSSKASGPDRIPVVVLKSWTFIHTSWTLQYVSERVLFSRLLESVICHPCI